MVNISEPDKKMVLSATLVKTLTGNDKITARFLNENSFEFYPQFKFFINTNHLPKVTDVTVFSSGRVKVIPFERHFDERDQDKGLKGRLSQPKNLSGVLNAPLDILKQVDGVGENAAILLRLVALASQRADLASAERDMILDNTRSIGAYLLRLFAQERNEAVYELCMDRKGKLLVCKRLGEGSASGVNLDVRKLVEYALLSSATYVVLAHNHPSGVALPSTDDHTATERARVALAAIQVELKDHIIVADGDFVSFSESGYFA